MKNLPITEKDVDKAEKIYGPSVPKLKGKSTRRKPDAFNDQTILLPNELKENLGDVVLHMDLLWVNGIPFMTTIDNRIRFRSAVALDGIQKKDFEKALLRVKLLYTRAGVTIPDLRCDTQFLSYENAFAQEPLKMHMSVTNTGAHESRDERNNRTIQERVRAIYHRISFTVMPKVMTRYLVMVATAQLTWFPAKGGISDHYSPHAIIHRYLLDYDRFKIPFGTYVTAHIEPQRKNTNAARVREAIYLRPSKYHHGRGHEVMDIYTGKVLRPTHVTVVPITQAVIDQVQCLGKQQKQKSFKIASRDKKIVWDSDWIAGVDYDESFDDSDYEPDDESDNESELDNDYYFHEEDEHYYGEYDAEDFVDDDDNESNPNESDDNEESTSDSGSSSDHNTSSDDEESSESSNDEESSESSDQESSNDEEPDVRRSGRQRKEINRLDPDPTKKSYFNCTPEEKAQLEQAHNIFGYRKHNPSDEMSKMDLEYDADRAPVWAMFIKRLCEMFGEHGYAFSQQFLLEKGLKFFGKRGQEAAKKEMDQLYKRN